MTWEHINAVSLGYGLVKIDHVRLVADTYGELNLFDDNLTPRRNSDKLMEVSGKRVKERSALPDKGYSNRGR